MQDIVKNFTWYFYKKGFVFFCKVYNGAVNDGIVTIFSTERQKKIDKEITKGYAIW